MFGLAPPSSISGAAGSQGDIVEESVHLANAAAAVELEPDGLDRRVGHKGPLGHLEATGRGGRQVNGVAGHLAVERDREATHVLVQLLVRTEAVPELERVRLPNDQVRNGLPYRDKVIDGHQVGNAAERSSNVSSGVRSF
jgi:hypothetical protein